MEVCTVMRKATVSDPVFERLITGRDCVTHNLFYLIREADTASVWTDDDICLMAQSNPQTPIWIALRRQPDAALAAEIARVIAAAHQQNPSLGVTVNGELGAEALERASALIGCPCRVKMPMVAYGCFHTNPLPMRGELVTPTAEDVSVMARLVQQMALDCEGTAMCDDDALGFAQAHVGSDRLFLWKDGGEAVSMARIPHRTSQYARVATVVTDRARRCQGYAGMMMKALCDKLLGEGVTPILYADARNPASNAMYRKVGMEETGRVTTFHWA